MRDLPGDRVAFRGKIHGLMENLGKEEKFRIWLLPLKGECWDDMRVAGKGEGDMRVARTCDAENCAMMYFQENPS